MAAPCLGVDLLPYLCLRRLRGLWAPHRCVTPPPCDSAAPKPLVSLFAQKHRALPAVSRTWCSCSRARINSDVTLPAGVFTCVAPSGDSLTPPVLRLRVSRVGLSSNNESSPVYMGASLLGGRSIDGCGHKHRLTWQIREQVGGTVALETRTLKAQTSKVYCRKLFSLFSPHLYFCDC